MGIKKNRNVNVTFPASVHMVGIYKQHKNTCMNINYTCFICSYKLTNIFVVFEGLRI